MAGPALGNLRYGYFVAGAAFCSRAMSSADFVANTTLSEGGVQILW